MLYPGEVTTIERENQRQKGQVEIIKISAGHNPVTDDLKDTLLRGAVFELYNSADELVETLETDDKG